MLTGDIHTNWVNELRSSFATPDAPAIAAEFVGTSITSGGDGAEQSPALAARLTESPHIKWQQSRRGYVTCTVTPDEWRAEYRTVPFVTRPDAPIETSTTWRLRHGQPGIDRV